jgi:hypothetical protein
VPPIASEVRVGREYERIRGRLAHPDEIMHRRLIFVLAEGYSSVTDFLVRLAGVDRATLGLEVPGG